MLILINILGMQETLPVQLINLSSKATYIVCVTKFANLFKTSHVKYYIKHCLPACVVIVRLQRTSKRLLNATLMHSADLQAGHLTAVVQFRSRHAQLSVIIHRPELNLNENHAFERE